MFINPPTPETLPPPVNPNDIVSRQTCQEKGSSAPPPDLEQHERIPERCVLFTRYLPPLPSEDTRAKRRAIASWLPSPRNRKKQTKPFRDFSCRRGRRRVGRRAAFVQPVDCRMAWRVCHPSVDLSWNESDRSCCDATRQRSASSSFDRMPMPWRKHRRWKFDTSRPVSER